MDDYTVTPIPARHQTTFPGENSSIYIIEHAGKKLLYGIDSGWYVDETWEYLEGIYLDCLILDCTSGFQDVTEVRNHMGFEENIRVMKRLSEKGTIDESTKLIATHFSHRGKVLYDRHYQEFEKQGITMSYDGMEIEI